MLLEENAVKAYAEHCNYNYGRNRNGMYLQDEDNIGVMFSIRKTCQDGATRLVFGPTTLTGIVEFCKTGNGAKNTTIR